MLAVSALDKIIDHLKKELSNLRTNRATPTLVENITILAYNTPTPLIQLASINVPEARSLVIQPWDKNLIKAIVKGIEEAQLDLHPVVQQDFIRINLPALTEEKRKELVKLMKEKQEDAKISLRQVRDEYLKTARQDQKSGKLSEDDYFRTEKEVQKQIDETNALIEKIGVAKEADIMTI